MTTAPDEAVKHDGPPAWVDERGVFCIRASGLASCTRMIAARFEGYDKMEAPEKVQDRFDDGHLHEPGTLITMAKRESVQVVKRSGETRLVVMPGKVEIVGHVDGVVAAQDVADPVNNFFAVAEAKAFSRSTFEAWMKKPYPGEQWGYGMQAVVYMLSLEVDAILYGVKNKDSGAVDVRWFKIDDPRLPTRGAIVKRALEIWRACTGATAEPAATMECDRSMFPCPVFYLHEEISKVESEDVVLREMLERYKTAQQQEAAAKSAKEAVGLEIADRLKIIGEDALEVMGWSVTAKVEERNAVDWDTIEKLTGKKKADFESKKPNSKATVRVNAPTGWTPGQQMLA